MNNTTLTGRLTRDPEVRHNAGANGKLAVAKYTLAVRRPRAKEGQPTADFIRCTAFGPKATFAENYLAKGMKIEVSGNLRTGSYVKDGQTINTFELIVNDQEFAESRKKNAEIFASSTESEHDFGDAELPFE